MLNPHTSFYFRTEVHMVSEEGLNAYGALTWGQFFIYQGFNERAGWMHTTGGGDGVDEYLETVEEKGGKVFYQYGNDKRAMRAVPITIPYKSATGMASRTITAYFSHHGPVVRAANGKWIAVKMIEEPLNALIQSYSRTKITNFKAFRKNMELRTNSSNNTTYADADGNIAYFHGNFIPKRNAAFDFENPVDGANPATEWQGLHAVGETITVKNPSTGWIQNTNNWPFSVSGVASPQKKDYPKYMWVLPENARGLNAVRVLEKAKDMTLDSLIAAAYDDYLQAFELLVPTLLKAYDELPPADPQKRALAAQVSALRGWDLRFALESVPTSLAVYWGQEMVRLSSGAARAANVPVVDYITKVIGPAERLQALSRASAKLEADFGSWQTPWGEINRFQRASGNITQLHDDSQPSIPVAFASGVWGSLPAYGMSARQTTKRIYGDRGNSFVAVVEFGPKLKAKSILAGGSSGNPGSPHFRDQAEMYARGQFKDVLFYPADIEKHLERKYHPGQ